MSITANQVKEIRQEFTKLKPSSVTLDGNRAMTVKQAIFTLAPTLERMKKRGFDTQEIVEKLYEKGIEVKASDPDQISDRGQTAEGRPEKPKTRHAPAASETRTTRQLHYP